MGREGMARRQRAGDQAVREALHKVVLAMAEVRLVERARKGELVQLVANPEALERAWEVYRTAAEMLGYLRQMDGTTEGEARPDRRFIREAGEQLSLLGTALGRLEGLEVLDGKLTRATGGR